MATINEMIIEFLETLSDEDTLEMWNEFQESYRYEDRVYLIDEVLECFLNDLSFKEALECIDKDEFDTDDLYAVDTIYGWKTFNDIFDVVDLGDLADYIENEREDFGYCELEAILEEEDDEEDED